MAKVLIVYHTQTGNTEKIARAVKEGIESCGIKVVLKKASNATLADLLNCDGYCFGSPDYFNYMAGALKDFFDRTCYPSEGKIDNRPCLVFVSHGGGGKAVASLVRMVKRFNLKIVAKPLLIEGSPKKSDLERARQWAKRLAEALT